MCVCLRVCAVRRKVGGVVCVHVHLGLSSRSAFQLRRGCRGGVGGGSAGGWRGGRGQARGQKGQVWVAGHLSS